MIVSMQDKGEALLSKCSKGFKSLVRRKQVDSVHVRREGHQLARKLTALDLIAIGIPAITFLQFVLLLFGFILFYLFIVSHIFI